MGFDEIVQEIPKIWDRVSEAENGARVIEQKTLKSALQEVKSYDYLVDSEKSFWKQHKTVDDLIGDILQRNAELLEFLRLPAVDKDLLHRKLWELQCLETRAKAALKKISDAIRALGERKNELYEELSKENRKNYNAYVRALPGDWDEGC